MRTTLRLIVFVAAALVGTTRDSAAIAIYQVTLDTSPLLGTGLWSLDLQFVDGDGEVNNSATLTNFSLGGGSENGSPTLEGGASGSIGSGVTLTDTSFFNAFTQPFFPGSVLSFDLTLTTNFSADEGSSPDRFSLGLLDGSGVPLPTTGLADELLGIDIFARPAVGVSATDLDRTSIDLGPPDVEATVPEPATLTLLVLGLGSLAVGRLRGTSRRSGVTLSRE